MQSEQSVVAFLSLAPQASQSSTRPLEDREFISNLKASRNFLCDRLAVSSIHIIMMINPYYFGYFLYRGWSITRRAVLLIYTTLYRLTIVAWCNNRIFKLA
jgi:hypothetical protein